MKRWSRSIFVFAIRAVALAGLGMAGCVTAGSSLAIHLASQPGERTIPIRVGVLPPIDARPEREQSPRSNPRASLILFTPSTFLWTSYGARLRHDAAIKLGPAPAHAFGNETVVDLLGSYVMGVIRGINAFEHVEPVPARSWSFDQLPRIARQTGLRYLLAMEVRHFYAVRSANMSVSGTFSSTEDSVVSQNSKLKDERTHSIESTVMRFRLFEIDGDQVRVFWQMSTRANQGSVEKELGKISGSTTATECLRQLAAGLDELTQRFFHQAPVRQ